MAITYDARSDRLVSTRPLYYAISWPYGRGWTTGDHPAVRAAIDCRAFHSRDERDEWVEAGPGGCESGHREAVRRGQQPLGWSWRALTQAARAWAYEQD